MNKSAENYIKTIYILKRQKVSIRSIDIARELGFSRASVSLAMSNLRKKDIITINEDGEIFFTDKGHITDMRNVPLIMLKHLLLRIWCYHQ